MIEIDGRLLNPVHIVAAYINTRHYMNGSESSIVVKLSDGSEIRRTHGYGFDAFETLKRIQAA